MESTQTVSPKNTLSTSDFGELRLDQELIAYEIFEMSTHNLGILCSYSLRIGDKLWLDLQGQSIELIVRECAGVADKNSSLQRFRLVSFEPNINFEKFFNEQRSRSIHNRIRMRHSRFPTVQTIPLVYAKTFGTSQVYKLRTINASRSGMLLEECQGSDAPFAEGTLLEVKIQPPQEEAISCLAKVVRCEWKQPGANKLYGIALTEIPNEYKDSFQSFIEALEEKSLESLRNQLPA